MVARDAPILAAARQPEGPGGMALLTAPSRVRIGRRTPVELSTGLDDAPMAPHPFGPVEGRRYPVLRLAHGPVISAR